MDRRSFLKSSVAVPFVVQGIPAGLTPPEPIADPIIWMKFTLVRQLDVSAAGELGSLRQFDQCPSFKSRMCRVEVGTNWFRCVDKPEWHAKRDGELVAGVVLSLDDEVYAKWARPSPIALQDGDMVTGDGLAAVNADPELCRFLRSKA